MFQLDLPLADWVSNLVDFLLDQYYGLFDGISQVIFGVLNPISDVLTITPVWAILLIVLVVAWWAAGWKVSLFSVAGLLLVYSTEMWQPTMETFALVVSAEVFTAVIGLPLG